MKILFLTNAPSPYRVDFFNELGKLVDLTVLYESPILYTRNPNWFNYEAKTFKAIYLKKIKICSRFIVCTDIIKKIKSQNFDAIIIGGYSTLTGMIAIEYLRINNIPFALNCDGGMIKEEDKCKYMLKKHFISSAAAWLSPANITDEYLYHYGAKRSKIYRYPFTSLKLKDIRFDIVNDEEKKVIRKQLHMKETKIIVSVGQFIYRKGFDVLLKAAVNMNTDVGIYIIGGNVIDEYLRLRNQFNLENIHFVEFQEKEALNQYYNAADLFVLPTREDIWGLVINEAMAHGLPVITTDKCISGLELIEDNKNGFIVPTNNTQILNNKINIILKNEEMRIKMGRNNIKKIKTYTIEKMAERHVEIIKEIIN